MALLPSRTILGIFTLILVTPLVFSQPNADLVDRMLKISKEKKIIKAKSDDSPVRKLRVEQFNIALEELQIRCRDFQNKLIRLDPVIEACRKMFRSELVLKDDSADRIKTYEEAIALVKWYESELEKNVKDGLGNKADYLKIRFDRLGLEVELLNEREGKPKTVPLTDPNNP